MLLFEKLDFQTWTGSEQEINNYFLYDYVEARYDMSRLFKPRIESKI